ncbi:MAG TPA: ABC transporter permease [bacterium]|nr:ABC transporter permease [bacterium]
MAAFRRRHIDLIWILVATELKQRYSGSILGILWVLVKPIFLFAVLNFVFSRIFAFQDPDYPIKLLTGIVLWNLFSEASTLSLTSLVSRANLITRSASPMPAFIMAGAVSAAINFFFNLVVLSVFASFYAGFPGFRELGFILAAAAATLLLAVVVGLFLSPFFVRYRDLNQIWEVVLTAGFYFTPIIYPITLIPENYRPLAILNPMTYIVAFAQSVVARQPFEWQAELAWSVTIILAAFVLSLAAFRVSSRRVAELL